MTDKEMEREIAKRTGLPRNAVRLFLDTQNDVIKESLVRQEEVALKGMLRIRSTYQTKTLRNPVDKTTRTVKMLILSVKPMRVFRQELNRWTSTQS
jgi:nucleoid DNA-binding protein